ncbi:MAG: ATP-binding cassette domain-containing protein [Acidimicrobiia bacterium]|nr:ATP-binding cassette domain-containing protein [Acidimicrobiia bacterium]MDX2466729.1 ATP-binding cassette domain-containing protein [Acidimicrobiia bacterium]
MLEIKNLHKSYGDVVALAGCTFSVQRGQLLGFLGPNGSGKTTTMRTVFSLVRPDAGEVRWGGSVIEPQSRLRFGYMPEQRGLYPRMKLAAQLSYFGRLHGMEKTTAVSTAHDWLERFDLGDRADDRLEELSHGNQQRVQLAAALIHSPDLLILDEPFSGLDPIGVEAMMSILVERAAQGTAVVFSSHQLDLVEDLCEDVVIIAAGKVVLDGPIRELRARSPHRYLDLDVATTRDDLDTAFADFEVVESTTGRLRLRVDDNTELEPIVHRAAQLGQVQQFSFTPPNLSEVFREVVEQ